MTQRKMAASGSEVTEAKIGRIHLLRQDNGGQDCGMRRTSRAQLETHLMLAMQCIILEAFMKVTVTPVKASSEWKNQWW